MIKTSLLSICFFSLSCSSPVIKSSTRTKPPIKNTGDLEPTNPDIQLPQQPDITPQQPENPDNPTPNPGENPLTTEPTFNYLDFVYKGEERIGLEEGKPVYWEPVGHLNEFAIRNSTSTGKAAKIYGDLWILKVMQNIIPKLKNLGISGITHLGLYNYRNIAGTNNPSRHSYGLAFDIAGFILKDGKYISVLKHWNDAEAKKIFTEAKDLFCQNFDIVLTPEFNAAHKDHFHVDLNPKNREKYEPTTPAWEDLSDTLAKSFSIDDNEIGVGEVDTIEAHPPIDYEAIEQAMQSATNDLKIADTARKSFCK